MKESPKRLRTPEAASHVGLASKTLEKWRVTGDGPPFIKLGRAVVYDVRDLDEWLDGNRKRSTSDEARP